MTQQKDEVGRTGIYPPGVPAPDDAEVITPGDINEGHTGRGKQGEAKKSRSRPRKEGEADEVRGEPTD